MKEEEEEGGGGVDQEALFLSRGDWYRSICVSKFLFACQAGRKKLIFGLV